MSNIVIDLRNYRDTSGSRVDPGRYRVQVEWAEESQARSGNTMITMGLNILGGEFNGSTLVDRLVLTDRSMFRVVGFLQAIGVPTPKKRLSISTDKFVGKVLEVNVDDGEPYNGTVKSEVRGYIKVTQPKKAADDDLPGEESTEEQDTADASEGAESGAEGRDKASEQEAEPEPEAEKADGAEKGEDGNPFDESNTSSNEDVDLDEVQL